MLTDRSVASLRTILATTILLLNTAGCGGGKPDAAAGSTDTSAGAAPAVAAQPDTGGFQAARAFLAQIYTPYTRGSPGGRGAVFTPELDSAVTRYGDSNEEGLGFDPFCGCQDFGEFSFTIQPLEPVEGGAIARVSITNFGKTTTVRLHLARRGGQWRVADIGEGDGSLRRMVSQ